MRLSAGGLVLGVALAVAAAGARAGDLPRGVERARPGLVLVVNLRHDGTFASGAGVVIDHTAVLTDLQVVASSRALAVLPQPASPSAAGEGGVQRFAFEHRAQLLDAALERGDPDLDLAVVRVSGGSLAPIPTATRDPRVGDRIWTLGPPSALPWTVYDGAVSAVDAVSVRHDATSRSGWGLVDKKGRILGIATGEGRARRVGAIGSVLPDDRVAAVDRSSPERALVTCRRALELGAAAWKGCLDPSEDAAILEALGGVMGDAAYAGAVDAGMEPDDAEALAVEVEAGFARKAAAHDGAFLPGDPAAPTFAVLLAQRVDSAGRFEPFPTEPAPEAFYGFRDEPSEALLDAVLRRTGARIDPANPLRSSRELARLGVEIEGRVEVTPQRVWLHAGGHNLDGSPTDEAVLLVEREAGWTILRYPLARDLEVLPSDWPRPAFDHDQVLGWLREQAAPTAEAPDIP